MGSDALSAPVVAPREPAVRPTGSGWRAPAVIVAATLAAYARCFSVPFLFDDRPAIVESNPTIRHLWPIWPALAPPTANGQTVGGRPLANLTLAINYAISGVHPWSYHVVNLLIHVAAALLLYGLVRRTLALPWADRLWLRRRAHADRAWGGGGRFAKCIEAPRGRTGASLSRDAAGPAGVAFAAALLWAVHPLETEAVTYVIQRVESLMALFYLLTLYAFVRSLASSHPGRWQAAAVAACLLGMGCKEVMVTAPVIVLLFDRAFLTGGFSDALRRRRGLYLGLAATWLLVLGLARGTHDRGGTAGFPLGGNWRSHLLTQTYALPHYLRLALWPYPLVFDYGYYQVHDAWSVVPQALLLAGLLGATAWGLWHRRPWSFLGAWFFIILSPSTVVPIPVQTMAEHRMYLPLAALAVGAALAAWRWLGRRAPAVIGLTAVALAANTYARNLDYQSDFRIWQTTALNHPAGSARACFNYAGLLAARGLKAQAAAQLERAIRIQPRFAAAYDNLGTVLLSEGRADRALAAYDRSIALDPKLVDPLVHSGLMLEQLGRAGEAERRLRAALALDRTRVDARVDLGNALFDEGRLDEAMKQYQIALRQAPLSAQADNDIGTIWFQRGDYARSAVWYRRALAAGRDSDDTRLNLGNALALLGRLPDAAEQYRAALRLDPADGQARQNLAKVEAALRGGREPTR